MIQYFVWYGKFWLAVKILNAVPGAVKFLAAFLPAFALCGQFMMVHSYLATQNKASAKESHFLCKKILRNICLM